MAADRAEECALLGVRRTVQCERYRMRTVSGRFNRHRQVAGDVRATPYRRRELVGTGRVRRENDDALENAVCIPCAELWNDGLTIGIDRETGGGQGAILKVLISLSQFTARTKIEGGKAYDIS